MPRPANCWNLIPPAPPCASVSPWPTPNGWRNWIAALIRTGVDTLRLNTIRAVCAACCNGSLKSAAAGGGDEMKRNIQHSTFNIQRPTASRGSLRLGCWALNVECLMFLLLAFFAQSAFCQATNALPPLSRRLTPKSRRHSGNDTARLRILARPSSFRRRAGGVLFCDWKSLQPKPPAGSAAGNCGARSAGQLAAPAGRRKMLERNFANPAPLCRHRV